MHYNIAIGAKKYFWGWGWGRDIRTPWDEDEIQFLIPAGYG